MECTLDRLPRGVRGIVKRVDCRDMTGRLYDIGFVSGTGVSCVLQSPAGDPRAYLVKGAVIALRGCDSRGILVEVK